MEYTINNQEIPADVKAGLQNLGVRGHVAVRFMYPAIDSVMVNGKFFGLWDTNKQTFVD